MSQFLCGASRAVITPPVGTLLYGYTPDTVSESVHDDLTVTALAVGDGERTALLVSLTLGDMNTVLCRQLKDAVAQASGVPVDRIVLAATHTHSAPNVSGIDGWGEIDAGYIDGILIPALKSAGSGAVASMVEAEVATAEGESYVGINRREQTEDGGIALGQNPWGIFDPTMTVIRFRNKETKQGIFNLIHYSCHGTAAGRNHEITRDWSGMMIDGVERETGVLTAFYNGSFGDAGPRLTNGKTVGDIRYVEELGNLASVDANRILKKVGSYVTPCFDVRCDTVRLPYQAYPRLSDIREQLDAIEEPEKLINIAKLQWKHLDDLCRYLTDNPNPPSPGAFTYEQTQIVIGDAIFIPAPFELFCETALRLRAYSGYVHTMTLSCADGYEGYLPSGDQIARGGYEVGVFRYASLNSLDDNTDQNLINETLRIIRNHK